MIPTPLAMARHLIIFLISILGQVQTLSLAHCMSYQHGPEHYLPISVLCPQCEQSMKLEEYRMACFQQKQVKYKCLRTWHYHGSQHHLPWCFTFLSNILDKFNLVFSAPKNYHGPEHYLQISNICVNSSM